ncbi:MAG TPA: phage antirepressor N-terminal domain-containing protein [Roseiflexaceae bacterium]|nr:phage antirepressor N-terminal domain-containing protein [Roseiflexaceae bacterium]
MSTNHKHSSDGLIFFGDDIIATIELDPNVAYASLADLCAALGLELRPQERRIRTHAILGGATRSFADDQGRRVLHLRLDLVPLWLTGLDLAAVAPHARERLAMYQRECASVLWQSFRPQGFVAEDELARSRETQTGAEQAYVAALAMATLARHQLVIERHIDERAADGNRAAESAIGASADTQAELLARAVRRVAMAAAEQPRRNEYGGVYSGLYRQFGISSYRRMPPARLHEALEWLERWRGDIMGEPEPPPDI